MGDEVVEIGAQLSNEPKYQRDLTSVIEGFAWMFKHARRWQTIGLLSDGLNNVRLEYKWMDEAMRRAFTEQVNCGNSAEEKSNDPTT